MPALAAATARRKGIEVDEARREKNLNDILTFFTSAVPRMMLGDPAVGGEAITTGYAQMALLAEGHPLDVTTGRDDALADGAADARWPLARQRAQSSAVGIQPHQPHGDSRRWVEVVSASWSQAARSRTACGAPASWLLAANRSRPRNAACASWAWYGPMRRAQVADRRSRTVRDQQEASGGWSQFGRTPPDAYATGLSLYALHVAGMRRPTTPTRRASHSCSAPSIRMGRGW